MNPNQIPSRFRDSQPGFALVVCLSLMILLTVIAVGLLSLASVSLRSSGQSMARSEAMANARLSLMLALNDLQSFAGPDTRITSPAGTLGDTVPQPSITGVWNSRKFNPSTPDTADKLTDEGKKADFKGWLISSADPQKTAQQGYITAAPTGATLLSKSHSKDGTKEVKAELVSVKSSSAATARGKYAYVVFDEGAKARANLGTLSNDAKLATRAMLLGGGQRPQINRIDVLTATSDSNVDLNTTQGVSLVSKMISIPSAELGHQVARGGYKPYFNDLTTDSLGLMTNVSSGGFKTDLNLLANAATPPADYGIGKKLYQTTYGINVPSDPPWQQVLRFANLFQSKNSKNKDYLTAGAGGLPTLAASAPGDWSASTTVNGKDFPNPLPPTSPVLLPSIAKVQMVYSMHAHDLFKFPKGTTPNGSTFINGPYNAAWKAKPANQIDTSNWGFKNAGKQVNYYLWMVVTPIVTLHNPYNVAMEIPAGELSIDFKNVPFAARFYINGVPQSDKPIPITRMFYWNDANLERRYTLNLYNKTTSGSSVNVDTGTPIRLLPGEVKVFSPYMNPNARYDDTSSSWYNVYNKNTTNIQAIPGWLGEGIGFAQDIVLPDSSPKASTYIPNPTPNLALYNRKSVSYDSNGVVNGTGRGWNGGIVLTGDEKIHVEFAPLPDPDTKANRFSVEMTLKNANSNTAARSVVVDFDYKTETGLQTEMLGKDVVIRYPEGNDTILATDLRDQYETTLVNYKNIKPFALFSAYAKTTRGGSDANNVDGRYPAKPWIFHNHTGAVEAQNVVDQHPSHHAHEINLERLPGHTEEAIDIQPKTDRGSFVTGHASFNGRRFGTMFEIPVAPIQSPVSLNGANLAAGYYLPRFTAPIGNSFAHPVMSSAAIIESNDNQTYADHSYLLNSILFDGYYCSGFQDRGGSSGDGLKLASLTDNFFNRNQPLPDSRFIPYLADGISSKDLIVAVSKPDGCQRVASYQLLKGAFNVNSTSVDAWKAVLSAMTGSKGAVSSIPLAGGTTTAIATLDAMKDDKGARFSRFRVPNSQPDASDPDALWHGPRDLTKDELDRLATEIVKQVRERGPFLSMGEFVNRQIGPSSAKTLVGALQAAINESKINESAEKLGGYQIDAAKLGSLEMKTPDALLGQSAQGAPGSLTQADILSLLGNSATVRSDTFIIRGYGESLDASGKATARAWCEAVVQRMPEYVDQADASSVKPSALTREANKRFGRRFSIVSFRWLNNTEV